MKVNVFQTTQEMGAAAAKHAAEILNKHIANGENPLISLNLQQGRPKNISTCLCL